MDDTLAGPTLPTSADGDRAFGSMIGRYLVLATLGKGGMGVVYEVYDPVLDRRIAVKVLRGGEAVEEMSEGRARMHREAQALARLAHPNVMTVFDVGEHDGATYIAMELITGKTLREWCGDQPWREVLRAYIAAGRGLAAAHEAGLIHRDVKPENVLIGDDGRIRVTDFGLARLTVDPPAPAMHATPSQLAENITVAGAVMGTPNYMAPEQIEGGTVDERSDQMSWAIACWEALYGMQPFIGGALAMRAAAMRSDPPKRPAETDVPRAIELILTRALKPEPAERWPSLRALLDALDAKLAPRKRGYLWLLVLPAALVIVLAMRTKASEPDCTSAGAPVAQLWTDATRDVVAKAYAATGAPFAERAAAFVDRAVSSWRTRWTGQAIESCQATRVHGTQSEAALDLRSACLLHRRDELKTTLAALAHVARAGVAEPPALPDLDRCTEVVALPPRPAGAQPIEQALDNLEEQLQRGLALDDTVALLPTAKAQLAAADALGWAPLQARAGLDVEKIHYDLGDGKHARSTLLVAAGRAASVGDNDALADLYVELAHVEARLAKDFALGDGWIALATGTLARLGPRPGLALLVQRQSAQLAEEAGHPKDAVAILTAALPAATALGDNVEQAVLTELGTFELATEQLALAKTHLTRALELGRAQFGDTHPRVAKDLYQLGSVAYRMGTFAEAEALYRQSLAIRVADVPDAVDTAQTIEAIGTVELAQDKVDDASRDYEKAIALLVARLGPEHPDVAGAYNDIGGAWHRAGRYAEALANQQKLLAVRTKVLGPDHPDVGQSLVNAAIEAKNLEQWKIVDDNYPRAIAIFEKAYGKDSFEIAVTFLNLGEARRAQRQFDAAIAAYERARDILVKEVGEDHIIAAHVWNGLGQTELARGRLDRAKPLLEKALAIRAKDASDATDLAETRFGLAQVTGDVAMAKQALVAYRAAGAGYAKRADAVEAWTRQHGER